jgi:hypothetical protein
MAAGDAVLAVSIETEPTFSSAIRLYSGASIFHGSMMFHPMAGAF